MTSQMYKQILTAQPRLIVFNYNFLAIHFFVRHFLSQTSHSEQFDNNESERPKDYLFRRRLNNAHIVGTSMTGELIAMIMSMSPIEIGQTLNIVPPK